MASLQAVKCFGPNFELISKLFPGRPRKALANKWRREGKLNPERIDEAYAGGGSLAGLQKVVEALGNTEVACQFFLYVVLRIIALACQFPLTIFLIVSFGAVLRSLFCHDFGLQWQTQIFCKGFALLKIPAQISTISTSSNKLRYQPWLFRPQVLTLHTPVDLSSSRSAAAQHFIATSIAFHTLQATAAATLSTLRQRCVGCDSSLLRQNTLGHNPSPVVCMNHRHNMQTTADGDVGDLGMDAAQMFGLAGPPPGPEGSDGESPAKEPPKKRGAKRPSKALKAPTVEDAAEGEAAGKELAIAPQAGRSFRKESSKRKPRKGGAATTEEGSQVCGDPDQS